MRDGLLRRNAQELNGGPLLRCCRPSGEAALGLDRGHSARATASETLRNKSLLPPGAVIALVRMRKPRATPDRSPTRSPRSVPLVIKLTVEEARVLAARAAAAGLPRAVFVRRSALGTRVVAPRVRAVNLRMILAIERENRALRALLARGVVERSEVELILTRNKKLHAELLCLASEDDR